MSYVIVLLNVGSNKVIEVSDNMPLLPENAVAFTHINQTKKDNSGNFEAKQYIIGKPVKNHGWDLYSPIRSLELFQAFMDNNLEKIFVGVSLKEIVKYFPMKQNMLLFNDFNGLNTEYCKLFHIDYEKEFKNIQLQSDLIKLFELYQSATNCDVKNDILGILLKYKDKFDNKTKNYFESLKLQLEKRAKELEETLIKAGATFTEGRYEFYETFEPFDAIQQYKHCFNYGAELDKIRETLEVLDNLLNQDELKR